MRHFNHHGLLENTWLQKHFDMYYYTILPGFKYTVGIADAPPWWIYGPEAQLHFLDSYVLKNGSGNWLADVIRKRRTDIIEHSFTTLTTLHMDFIYYNQDLTPRPPSDFNENHLHVFDDWGVATYRSGPVLSNKTTFVTFKSSFIRGKYLHLLSRHYPEFLKLTNPGHEHPDQNSFTLTFLGDMFITEGFYSQKNTTSNNVHMFYPSNVSIHCSFIL